MSDRGEPGRRVRRVFDLPVSEDVRREMEFHIRSKVDELVAAGWTESDAEAEALRRFGDPAEHGKEMHEIVRRQRRSARRALRLESIVQDVRVGGRGLLRDKGFTAVAVLTLALGIGANAAVFSVISGLLIRPLPYPEADRLVSIWEVNERGGSMHVTEPNFKDWQAGTRSFEAMAVHPSGQFGGPITVLGGAEPVRVEVSGVSVDFFEVMRVEPSLGRAFVAEDVVPGATLLVVSDAFWRTQLGSTTDLAQVSLRIGGGSYPVIGVMPPGFHFPGETEVWALSALDNGPSRTSHNWAVLARLRDGVTVEAAQRELSALAQRIRAEYGEEVNAVDVRVVPLRDELFGDIRRPLGLLLGAAGLVLLLGCTNLASTLLARAGARAREFAVRASLGAARTRLVRQLLTESLLVSLAGGVVGLALAGLAIRTLIALGPASVAGDAPITIDVRVLAFAFAVAVASAVLFGLVPALRVSHADPGGALREGSRGNAGGRSSRLWGTLVAAEVALAVVLLISAGLILRSFQRVLGVDPGFDPRGVLTAQISVPSTLYPDDAALSAFYARALGGLRELPGVEQAGLVNHLPLSGVSINGSFEIEGEGPADGYADYRIASEGYFEALGIPLVEGRVFDAFVDRPDAPTVVIVNQTFVRRHFPEGHAVGRRIRNLANDGWIYGREEWLTVIGVVGDVRHDGPLAAPSAETYVYVGQRPYRARDAYLVVSRRSGGPDPAPQLREVIRAIDPNVPIEIMTMEARFAATLAERRFSMAVLAAFAGLALLLAAVGIYGVVSYSVERRTREMGVRLALGARPGGVIGRTMRRALAAVAAGLIVGVPAALAGARLLQGLLYETPPADLPTFAAVLTVLVAVSLVASWVPARRIAGIDPAITLRAE